MLISMTEYLVNWPNGKALDYDRNTVYQEIAGSIPALISSNSFCIFHPIYGELIPRAMMIEFLVQLFCRLKGFIESNESTPRHDSKSKTRFLHHASKSRNFELVLLRGWAVSMRHRNVAHEDLRDTNGCHEEVLADNDVCTSLWR